MKSEWIKNALPPPGMMQNLDLNPTSEFVSTSSDFPVYHYDWGSGNYEDQNGNWVSWSSVYSTDVLPNATTIYNSVYSDTPDRITSMSIDYLNNSVEVKMEYLDSWSSETNSSGQHVGFNDISIDLSGMDYMVYDANWANKTRTAGNLNWYDSNGNLIKSYPATSGSGKPKLYTIPRGIYLAGKLIPNAGYKFRRHDGVSFKVILEPSRVWDPYEQVYRTLLRIHPARYEGTSGCIGLISNDPSNILDFENRYNNYFNSYGPILVIVTY